MGGPRPRLRPLLRGRGAAVSDRSIKLADIQAGAKRASEVFDKWPNWKREISEGKAMSDRNIKLNDHCDQCPWHRTAYGAFWCCYEPPPARRIGQTDLPPDWCPIRGKVVTIEGPEVES